MEFNALNAIVNIKSLNELDTEIKTSIYTHEFFLIETFFVNNAISIYKSIKTNIIWRFLTRLPLLN